MDTIIERCAGLDIGKKSLTACVRTPDGKGGRRSQTRTFRTMTRALLALRDWLVEQRVSVVGMESTSTYRKPAFYGIGRRHRLLAAQRPAPQGGPWSQDRRPGRGVDRPAGRVRPGAAQLRSAAADPPAA